MAARDTVLERATLSEDHMVGNIAAEKEAAAALVSANAYTDAAIAAIASGTDGIYTPTLTNVLNVASSFASSCQYLRIGDTVTVSGQVDITATASSTTTKLGVSLPIASNFIAPSHCSGTAATVLVPVRIYGDITNHRAEMYFQAISVSLATFNFTFTYRITP